MKSFTDNKKTCSSKEIITQKCLLTKVIPENFSK